MTTQDAWQRIAFSYSYETAAHLTGPHLRHAYVKARQHYLETHDSKMFNTVADIASGNGALTFYALTLDSTHLQKVYASDYTPALIELLDQRTAHTGLAHKIQSNVLDARQVDTVTPPHSVDLACIMFGLMLMPEPEQVLLPLKQCLKADGLVCVTVWDAPDRSQLHTLLGLLLKKFAMHPSVNSATPESESMAKLLALPLNTVEKVTEVFSAAGYEMLHCQPYTAPLRLFENALDFVTHIATSTPFAMSGTAEERAAYLGSWMGSNAAFTVHSTSIIAVARVKQ